MAIKITVVPVQSRLVLIAQWLVGSARVVKSLAVVTSSVEEKTFLEAIFKVSDNKILRMAANNNIVYYGDLGDLDVQITRILILGFIPDKEVMQKLSLGDSRLVVHREVEANTEHLASLFGLQNAEVTAPFPITRKFRTVKDDLWDGVMRSYPMHQLSRAAMAAWLKAYLAAIKDHKLETELNPRRYDMRILCKGWNMKTPPRFDFFPDHLRNIPKTEKLSN